MIRCFLHLKGLFQLAVCLSLLFSTHLAGKNSIYLRYHKDFCCPSGQVCYHALANRAQLLTGKQLAKQCKAQGVQAVRTLVLDAGHGGKDTGANYGQTKEKNVALNITLEVGRLVAANHPDVQVIYTRNADVFIPLEERAKIANRNEADLFVSIHCNALPPSPATRGTETYVLGLHRADDQLEVVKRENASILFEDNYQTTYSKYDPNSPEGHIFLSSLQNNHLNQSIRLASMVEDNFKETYNRRSLGVKQAGFLVLRATTMPSVLVETGFLTNKAEANYLASAKGQSEVAYAIYKSFYEYKAEIEGIETPAPPPPSQTQPAAARVVEEESSIDAPQHKTATAVVVANHTPPISNNNNNNNNISFKIQLASAPSEVNTKLSPWTKLESFEIEQYGNIFKYVVGPFDNYKEAIAQQNFLRKIGFKQAFVVAYEGNARTDLQTALLRLGLR